MFACGHSALVRERSDVGLVQTVHVLACGFLVHMFVGTC